MYKPMKIVDGIYWIGVNDHETELFEAMWPLPRGVSYNAYIVRGKKVALVEPVVEVKMAPVAEQLEQCAQLGRNLGERLD